MRYFLLFFCLVIWSCAAQKNDCSDFKTGKFKYADKSMQAWSIVRTDTSQIETNKESGVIIKSTIEWTTNCSYILTYDEVINSPVKDIIGKKIEVDILNVSDSTYIARAISDVIDNEVEIIKINQ